MIPLVIDAEELRIARSWVTGVLDEIGHPELASDAVTVGAMIETPRAALTAAHSRNTPTSSPSARTT
jgi:phosphoenolpyruvate-protein kinase (PTS system EI component)